MIAVDGLGADIFARYDSLFSGGFRRLKDTGMSFTRASVNHAFTISHPGHVTLSTGMNPSHHGIVDAAFYQHDGQKWRYVDAVQDTAEQIVGVPGSNGVSGKNVRVSSLPEWIVAADAQARFVSLGTGQYSSLLHAGHARGDVYWYDIGAARYVTSTYYRQDYPEWLERFNRDELPKYVMASAVWENTVPLFARKLARRDDAPYEVYGRHTSFPHVFKRDSSRANDPNALSSWFKSVPMADEATLALAKAAITARKLGQRSSTDYLSIVVSQVDDIGHGWGSGSQEQLDNLLRLDRELGDFFAFLDKIVGKDEYVVALSADHGMMDIPEALQEQGQYARRVTETEINKILKDVTTVISQSRGSRDEVAAKVAAALERYDFVADAMTPKQMLGKERSADPFVSLFRNSYSTDRVPRYPLFNFSDGTSPVGEAGVVVRLKAGVMIDLDSAVHGTAYDVDRNVPLIFMGKGVSAGTSIEEVHTTDVAPTLADLAGIAYPSGLDGRSLLPRKPRKKIGS